MFLYVPQEHHILKMNQNDLEADVHINILTVGFTGCKPIMAHFFTRTITIYFLCFRSNLQCIVQSKKDCGCWLRLFTPTCTLFLLGTDYHKWTVMNYL